MSGEHLYLLALGSNQRHHRLGDPRALLASALAMVSSGAIEVVARSKVVATRPLGPSQRVYANAAAIVRGPQPPDEMLALLQQIEKSHGRTRIGQRWRARTLDLDIILWSGGRWRTSDLTIPHPLFRERRFVLGPAASIAPDWRDPVTALTLRQLHARLTRPQVLPRGTAR